MQERRYKEMTMPKDEIQGEMAEAWRTYMGSLEKSLEALEKDIDSVSKLTTMCTDEWCETTEHVIDDLGNALFSISEPRGSTPEDSTRIRGLKKRLHDLYANYKEVYNMAKK